MPNLKPLVGVVADVKTIKQHDFHFAGERYLKALTQHADVVPVIIPAIADFVHVRQWISRIDGLFLTGAYSMVDPAHYGQSNADESFGFDTKRDTLSFALVRAATTQGMPVFGVCRGFQDANVAFGGSLHQSVHEVTGLLDHREDQTAAADEQFREVHTVTLTEGGKLFHLIGTPRLRVNSLHVQGVDRPGKGLTVEARAEDGLIEALSIDALDFGMLVQWHPEWQPASNPLQRRLFTAFGEACRDYENRKS